MTSLAVVHTPGLRGARAALSAIFFFSGAGLGLWAAHIPVVQAGLGLGKRDLGLALLAMSLGAVLMMPLTGFIAARLGSGRATLITALVFAVTLPLPIVAADFSLLIAAVLAFGASFGAMDIAMNTHATRLEARWGSPIMSSVHGFYSLGGLFGAALGSGIVAAGLGGGGGVVLFAAAAGLAVVALRGLLLAGGSAARSQPGPLLALPRGPAILLGALAFAAFMAEGAVLDWSGVYLVELGSSAAAAASGYAGFSLTMVLCRFLGDPVVARLGRPTVLGGGGALVGLGFAVAVVLPEQWAAVLGFAIVGVGAANLVPVLFTLAGRLPGIPPAYGVAGVATPGYAGLLVGPPLIGFVAEHAGLWSGFLMLALLGAMLAVGGYLVARRRGED
jgi:fucose permease